MERVIRAPGGRPTAKELAGLVCELRQDDPLCEIQVVVPSGYASLSLRHLLGSGELGATGHQGRSGLFGVSFLTMRAFLDRLVGGRLSADGMRPLAAGTELAAVRNALIDDPGPFLHLARHVGTASEVRNVVRELRWCSDAMLERIGGSGPRLEHLIRLYRRIRSQLAPLFYDEVDVVEAATVAASGNQASLSGNPVVLYCLGGLHKRLVSLFDLFQARVFSIEVPANIGPQQVPGMVVSCADPDEEVRLAIRHVSARMEEGIPLWRQAILYPRHGPYPTIISQQLEAAGVPFCGPSGRSLDRSMPGRFLLGLFDLSLGGWRREDVISWLAGNPIVVSEGGSRVPVAAWDAISISAGVTDGAPSWLEQLAKHAASIDMAIASDGRDGSAADGPRGPTPQARGPASSGGPRALGAGRHEELLETRKLSDFIQRLLDSVAQAPVHQSWQAACGWAISVMKRLLDPVSERARWPAREQDDYQQVQQILRTLADIDDVLGPPGSVESLREVIATELRSRVEHGMRFGEGVFVAPIATARGMDFDDVVIVGLAESYLPGQQAMSSLLPEVVRRETDGELDTRHDRIAMLEDDFRAAIAVGLEGHWLLWPRTDPRQGRANVVSRWLLAELSRLTDRSGVLSVELSLLAGERPDVLASAGSSIGELAKLVTDSFPRSTTEASGERMRAASSKASQEPQTAGLAVTLKVPRPSGISLRLSPSSEWELDVSTLLSWVLGGSDPLRHWSMSNKPSVRRGIILARARSNRRFTSFDGLVGSAVEGILANGGIFSATSLESYASCPMRYLFSKVLDVTVRNLPEDSFSISALDRGSLVHDVLERYTKARIAGSDPDLGLLLGIAGQVIAEYTDRGLLGRSASWRYERMVIERELERFHSEDVAEDLEPLAAELPFGMDCAPPVRLHLGNGREVRFRGRADRVDRRADGSLVVTDYKTGSNADLAKLGDDCVLGGTKLQLPLYALAAAEQFEAKAPVDSRYWFVSQRGQFAKIGYTVDSRVLERFSEVLETILDGISAGIFPARPGEPTQGGAWEHCRICDYNAACPLDRERQWVAKREDPRLAAYLELCGETPGETGDAARKADDTARSREGERP